MHRAEVFPHPTRVRQSQAESGRGSHNEAVNSTLMGGASNHNIRFPRRSSHVAAAEQLPGPDSKFKASPIRSKRAAERREAGVLIVSTELKNSPLAVEASTRPRRGDVEVAPGRGQFNEHARTDRAGRPSPLSSQIDAEGLSLLAALDPDDPHLARKRRGIIKAHRRVWEEHGATPLVIDFSEVQEPIAPERIHPSKKGSKHPQRPLYEWAVGQAYTVDPKRTRAARAVREQWYWDQMDRGKLPADFNPYIPGSQKHSAFEDRVALVDDRPTTTQFSQMGPDTQLLDTPKQRRARARRKVASGERLTDEEFVALYDRPVEEWDIEELAAGRPRDRNGQFVGKAPSGYMQAEIRERIDGLFKQKVRGSMNVATVDALKTLHAILGNDDTDFKGKPVVAASTKLDAAKFLVEHLLGKPTQRTETDISVKLSGMLASVMVAPEMAVPTDPSNPVSGTGRMLAGQRGTRLDYQDTELLALTSAGYVDPILDAEVVDDDD